MGGLGDVKMLLIATAVCVALFPCTIQAQAVVELNATDLTVAESDGNVSVCVEVTQGNILVNSEIFLNSISVSTTAGTDYTPFDELVLVFTPGGPRIICRPFFVRVDGDLEGTEVVSVSLTSVDVTIGPRRSVRINILDSDQARVGFERTSYTVREGSGRIEVCAERLQGTVSRQLTLMMSVIPEDMSEGNASSTNINSLDYAVVQQPVDLAADITRVCAMFGSVDDNDAPILEELEFYQVTLTTTDTAVIDPALSVANIFIEDNDGANVTIETPFFSEDEGNDGTMNTVQVCVRLTDIQSGLMRDLVFSLTVDFDSADSDDFMPSDPQALVFPSDSSVGNTQCVSYQIVGDDFKEIDDTLTIIFVPENSDDVITNSSPQIPVIILDDGDLVQFCEGLPNPTKGTVALSGTREDSTATYTCDLGYILVGQTSQVCQRNAPTIPGVWSGSAPVCNIANCGLPPMPGGITVVQHTTTTYLSEATYSCSDSCYQLIPNTNTLVCEANEQWSPSPTPVCQVRDCGPPPAYENCTEMSTSTACGSLATYSPLDPATIRIFGDTELTCGTDDTWQADPVDDFPFCIPRGICPAPPTAVSDGCLVEITRPSFTSLEANAEAIYSCPAGCFLTPSNATTRICTAINLTVGFWSGDTPTCTGVTCPELTLPTNGWVDFNVTFMGTATYSCMLGYMLDGAAVRTCKADGEWSGVAPSCVPVECPNLTLANGNVTVTGINPNDMATYTCDEGYSLEGNSTRTCQVTATWNGTEPTCFLDCGNDTEAESFTGTRNTSALAHGTMTVFTCRSENCTGPRTCSNGTWSGQLPSCEVSRCPNLSPGDGTFTITHDDNPLQGSVATYSCDEGIEGDTNTRTCQCSKEWTSPVPICAGGRGGLPIGAIIGIAIAAAILLIILFILIMCCIAYCVRSRKKYNDKQLDSAYREFMRPYTTPYNTPATPLVAAPQPRQEAPQPVEEMEKEILRSEGNFEEEEEEEEDDFCSPTPSDEDMDEYRLRMRDVETQSTGSQHRIKPRIVAEKVEVDI